MRKKFSHWRLEPVYVDPDQTAPRGSDLGPHSLQNGLLKSQADDKADDNCCDWQSKG